MKIGTTVMTAVTTAVITAAGVIGAPPASATTSFVNFGTTQKLYDDWGTVVSSWKISGLKKSSDTIPQYPLAGQLWEASAVYKAESGSGTPIIPNFNARPEGGPTYRVLWQSASPNGISGATITEGTESKGKLYFDVTGPNPTQVAYYNGAEDLYVWGK